MSVISTKVLLARLNRQLRPTGHRIVRVDRVSLSHGHLGQFCLVDECKSVVDQDVDLQRIDAELKGLPQG